MRVHMVLAARVWMSENAFRPLARGAGAFAPFLVVAPRNCLPVYLQRVQPGISQHGKLQRQVHHRPPEAFKPVQILVPREPANEKCTQPRRAGAFHFYQQLSVLVLSACEPHVDVLAALDLSW